MKVYIRMYYNPYLCTVQLKLKENNKEMELDGTASDLQYEYRERFCLEDDGDILLDKLKKSYRGAGIDIEFIGTDSSFKLFNNICKNKKVRCYRSTEKKISSYDEISERIKTQISELKKSRFEIDKNGMVDSILDSTIPIVVIGKMSAGKSSLINALIGEEVLPSGQDPTTGLNCKIYNSRDRVSISFSINGNNILLDCTDNSFEENHLIPEELKKCLRNKKPYEVIREVISFYNFKDKSKEIDRTTLIDNKLIEIKYPFYNKNIPEHAVFIDTPGDNSNSNKEDMETLRKALEDQIKGFLIVVCAGRKELDMSEDLINLVYETSGAKLDLSHTIVVVNQTEYIPEVKRKSYTEKEWGSRIIYTSSIMALGTRKKSIERGMWKESNFYSIYKRSIELFTNPTDEDYICLPQYCSLPDNRKDKILTKHIELIDRLKDEKNSSKEKLALIEYNSGITTVENEIIFVSKELFPFNQCMRAKEVFLNLLAEYKVELEKVKSEKDELLNKRTEEFNLKYKEISDELTKLTSEYIISVKRQYVDRAYRLNPTNCDDAAAAFEKEVFENILSYRNVKKLLHNTEEELSEELEGMMDKERRDTINDKVREKIQNDIKYNLGTKMSEIMNNSQIDFDKYMRETVIPQYAKACKKKIDEQEITEEEKEIFKSFFSEKTLLDATKVQRENDIDGINPKIPRFKPTNLSGGIFEIGNLLDNIFDNVDEFVFYYGKKIYFKLKKAYISIYKDAYLKNNKSIISQVETIVSEYFNGINNDFEDQTSENNIICSLHPELDDIKREINQLTNEMMQVNEKMDYIEGELNKLNDIFVKIQDNKGEF